MCFIVLPKPPVQKLLGAAANVQALLDDGTLADAFGDKENHATQLAITAFDILAENVAKVQAEQKEVSPFLRYRQEILGGHDIAKGLRALVMNLCNGRPGLNLSSLFMGADEHHTRIALECIASYTKHGEYDRHFMDLAVEICEREERS